MKGEVLAVALTLVMLFLASILINGGFKGITTTITGKATSDTTALNLTIGNTAPTIGFVSAIAAISPVENSVSAVFLNFTATDSNGPGDLKNISAVANFQISGQTTRYNLTCSNVAQFSNSINYTCSVEMWYFDQNGAWTINVSINDSANARAENSTTTFTYNTLTAMAMFPKSLTWPNIEVTTTNTGSSTDPITLNNTGNVNISVINITALNLHGETTVTNAIFAGNFSINVADASEGTVMINGTTKQISNAVLLRGNHSINNGNSGQEQLFFFLEAVNPDLSTQSYSTAGGGAWTVAIFT